MRKGEHNGDECRLTVILLRLRTELAKLRKMYEEQTEKAKNEFMYLHSNKVKKNTQNVKIYLLLF